MNKTDNLPDFSPYGYRVSKKLGQDNETGCTTWQGKATTEDSDVVIKQFRFATQNSSWSGYQAFKQEVEFLKRLNHPSIPQYLASFETDNSFCFVRKYIVAKPLAELTTITEKLCKIIAVKVLDVLIYLQQQNPPLLYLNITPNTVLLDEQNNIYLINFSYIQTPNTKNNSPVKIGNAEFIAPEQLKNPDRASDIYGLGCTLKNIINNHQSLSLTFDNSLDDGFLEWLNTATEPEIERRYSDAETAIKALKASSWDDLDSIIKTSNISPLSQKAFAAGMGAMIILGFAIALGINITQKVTEKSFINITIALMGMIIISLTQSASATIVTNNNWEKKQGIILSVAIPLVITIIVGIFFGKGEAVALSFATVLAQTIAIGYVLWQKLSFNQPRDIQKIAGFIIAISFGIYLGTALL